MSLELALGAFTLVLPLQTSAGTPTEAMTLMKVEGVTVQGAVGCAVAAVGAGRGAGPRGPSPDRECILPGILRFAQVRVLPTTPGRVRWSPEEFVGKPNKSSSTLVNI